MPPVSRRRLLAGAGTLAGLGVAAPLLLPSTKATASVSSDLAGLRARARSAMGSSGSTPRPTGAEYVRYEDLYRSGDTVSSALARLTQPKIVTFPEGQFAVSNFNSGFQTAIDVPSICRGIIGSGRGTVGGSTGTVFSIKPWSSSKGDGARDSSGKLFVPSQDNSTPCQLTVLKQLHQRATSTWKNFQVAGTEQGHIFNGFQVYDTAGANTFENILISGWSGNNGAPPGETYGLGISGPGAHSVSRVELDGRRTSGGEIFAAMGLTLANTSGGVLRDCYAHDLRTAGYSMFQSVNGFLINCTADATAPADKAIGNGGMNFERTSGFTVVNPTLIGRSRKVHLSHSTDNWAQTLAGVTTSVRNGSLKIVNPTFNDLWGNNMLVVESWSPYGNGDSITRAPLVTREDWSTHLPYKWAHGAVNTIY